MKVGDAHMRVAVRFSLAPKKKGIFGGVHLLVSLIFQFNLNVLNLKSQNDCPEETENEGFVAINDVLCTDAFQFDLEMVKG